VLFAGTRAGLPAALRLEDGRRVRAYGEVTVFESRGQYQLIVRKVEPGLGELMQRFEELKRKLQPKGCSTPAASARCPAAAAHRGIVTSPTGAVIHDMLNVLGRRFPNLQIRLAPVKVQGAGAAEEIAAAVALFNRLRAGQRVAGGCADRGRGGGSLEDLWAFNEEAVARAVAARRFR
jgi:exodeoxyribonuclease VII large subunit